MGKINIIFSFGVSFIFYLLYSQLLENTFVKSLLISFIIFVIVFFILFLSDKFDDVETTEWKDDK